MTTHRAAHCKKNKNKQPKAEIQCPWRSGWSSSRSCSSKHRVSSCAGLYSSVVLEAKHNVLLWFGTVPLENKGIKGEEPSCDYSRTFSWRHFLGISVKKGQTEMTTSACLTRCISTLNRSLYVWQVTWGLDLGKSEGGWAAGRVNSCVWSKTCLGEQGLASVWEADKLLLGWWSKRLLSTW